MANPPIVIGTFDNVPAPGSPIKSDWPQEISTFVQALPRGYVAESANAADQTVPLNATVDIANCAVTFQAVSTRRYRTTLFVDLVANATGMVLTASIADGANNDKRAGAINIPAGGMSTIRISVVEWGINGSTTRKGRVTMAFGGAGGTATILGTALRVASITVDDIGSTNPIPTALPADDDETAEATPA